MKKFAAMLYLYHCLETGKEFKTSDVMELTGSSMRSCNRYIHDIKEYLKEFEPNREVTYSTERKTFLLRDKNQQA